MAEQTFRSPGFFEQEIDLSGRVQGASGTPAGLIGAAIRGPAFVPVTVGSFDDFKRVFGGLSPELAAPYAAKEWLVNRPALTFTRVLGAGANNSINDISKTKTYGVVKNAGFVISGTVNPGSTAGASRGTIKFIIGAQAGRAQEAVGYPVFTDNASFPDYNVSTSDNSLSLIRGMVLLATGTTLFVTESGARPLSGFTPANLKGCVDYAGATPNGTFMLILSSSSPNFVNDAGKAGGNSQVKIYSASLDPSSPDYIAKILNTDPAKFQTEEHLLYADFAVEDEIASVVAVGLASGSLASPADINVGGTAGKFQDLFGRFDTRYTTPTTTFIISQPYGKKEFDLFKFETLDDGAWGNDKLKISIANVVASTDSSNPYGSFDVQVRRFDDNDLAPQIIESFPSLSLDPSSDRFIARVIGDKKAYFNHDAEIPSERRIMISGKYPNKSQNIRVVISRDLEVGEVPSSALPFGFRGVPVLKVSDTLTWSPSGSALTFDSKVYGQQGAFRLAAAPLPSGTGGFITGSIVPPLPLRYKVTRGVVSSTDYDGQPGSTEMTDARFYWGVKFERVPLTSSLAAPALNPNASQIQNPIVSAYSKFLGIQKLDMLVTGAAADAFNNNGFSLSRVALGPDINNGSPTAAPTAFSQITGSADAHMRGAVYVRNATLATRNIGSTTEKYVISSDGSFRVTLATLLASSSVVYNRFAPYAKFTTMFYGGFDGTNILNRDAAVFNDRASSKDADGLAAVAADVGTVSAIAGSTNPFGAGIENNAVASIRAAVDLSTDPFVVNTNLLAIPGIRDSLVTDYAADRTRAYSQAMYIMDIPAYGMVNGETSTRLYNNSSIRPDVLETAEQFAGRTYDNNYVATYFPDVFIDDTETGRRVKVPASVAALSAFGYNDRVSYPWFAPAGFNRGALDFVRNTETRLTQEDKDTLYSYDINPIANFPQGGFVIFGQKTLQRASSALDRVNVRRAMLEVKRIVGTVAQNILFEQNTVATRNRFIAQATPQLALIQAQQGIDSFRIVMDDTNNTDTDREQNRLNGRVIVTPTRAIEFIAVDFVITNAGVQFT